MAAVPIVLVGTMKDNDSGEEKNVTITGMAGLQGYHPAHPIPPNIWPDPIPKPPGSPPGFWGPLPGFPTPPIQFPPGWVGGVPPGGGGGGDKPPQGPLFDWKIAWSPDTGWIVVGVPNVPHPVPST